MQSESQNVEYKESWRDEYLKWICGFANAHGGSFVESWGRGYKKIAEGFSQAGMKMPTIEECQGGVNVTICRKSMEDIIAERGGDGGVSGGNDGGNVAVIELTSRQRLILSYIVKQPDITAKQMAVMTDIPQRTIERELTTLQKKKVLSRDGSPRTGRWVIVKM